MSPFKIYLHYVEIHHSLSHPNVCQLGSPICIISICSRVYHIPNLSYADLNHPDPFICHMTWLIHTSITFLRWYVSMLTWITKTPLMCSPTPYVIIYLMLTWITQTHSYADVYLICIYVDLDHQGSFCDHPDLSCEAYADLDHSDLFIYQILDLNHPLYANMAYPYRKQFFRVICI